MVGNFVRDLAGAAVAMITLHPLIRCVTGASGNGDSVVSGTAVSSATRTECVDIHPVPANTRHSHQSFLLDGALLHTRLGIISGLFTTRVYRSSCSSSSY